MSYDNIPMELRVLNQWVGANADKRPIDPKSGRSGNVSDPSTWGTFEQACRCGTPHIGFVFTKNDPYVFIDLDTGKVPSAKDLHASIVIEADSWTETSRSGKSSHIVVKGELPDGLRDDAHAVEIYPHGRHMICTGWTFVESPIRDCQELLDYLASMINSKRFVVGELTSEAEIYTDNQLLTRIAESQNGQKFIDLYEGNWIDYDEYNSDHSRADLGFATFLDFYSRNVDQCVRIWKRSKLYRPDKGRRNGDGTDYIIRTLTQARARNEADQNPPIDAAEILQRAEQVLYDKVNPKAPEAENETTPEPLSEYNTHLTLPPGLVGEVAQYIFSASIRPVKEVALMGALALVGGIVGRQYNISGTGLNQYLILLAPTGIGKEGASSGIAKILSKVRETVPAVDEFQGPADFASGPALIKTLDKKPSFFSIVGEFGLKMQQLADPRVTGADKTLLRVLLDLYNKSGWHQTILGSAYSDQEKNTKIVQAPNVTLFGESTPETFFAKLDENTVKSGLLPRFAFLIYKGHRPPKNKISAFCDPDPQLIQKMCDLVATTVGLQTNGQCTHVMTDSEAQIIFDDFDHFADARINSSSEVYKHLWNRADVKALKLAGLLAVGVNNVHPIVTKDIAQWAVDFIRQDIMSIETMFRTEKIGNGEHLFENEIRDVIEEYLAMNEAKRDSYKIPASIKNKQIIPFTYLRRRLRQRACFREDKRGPAKAIQEALRDLVDAGILHLIPARQRSEKYGLTTELYAIGQSW